MVIAAENSAALSGITLRIISPATSLPQDVNTLLLQAKAENCLP
jgi:hypothetical protein